MVRPWKTFKLDPEYRGGRVVVGDLTGDGVAEIVSARDGVPGKDIHYISSVVVHRLDGSALWKWGNPDARNALHHDVTGNGRPDLVVNTVPGPAVWIYKNKKGAKNLSRERLTMPENATPC